MKKCLLKHTNVCCLSFKLLCFVFMCNIESKRKDYVHKKKLGKKVFSLKFCFLSYFHFSDFRPTSLEKGQELFRLRMYEIYAWGVPFIIAGVAAILDHLPENPENTFLRPNFGKNTCWFYGDKEIFTYFFGPIGFLLCINVLLFASTTRQLTCGLWKRDDVKSTTERYVKLKKY